MAKSGMNELEGSVSVQADDKPPEPIKVTSSGGGLLEDPDPTDKPPEPIK